MDILDKKEAETPCPNCGGSGGGTDSFNRCGMCDGKGSIHLGYDHRCSVCRINNPRGCHPQCPCHCHKP